MAIYKYKCTKCNYYFEKIRTIEERDSECKCPCCKTIGERQLTCANIPGCG